MARRQKSGYMVNLNLQERELSRIHPTDRALRRKVFGTGVRFSVRCVNECEASGV